MKSARQRLRREKQEMRFRVKIAGREKGKGQLEETDKFR